MKRLLIDADILLYQAASACQNETEWEPDVWSLTCDINEAKEMFDTNVFRLLNTAELFGYGDYALCFSDRANFRKEIYPDYKGNRSSRKPVGFVALREKLIGAYEGNVVTRPGIEADDCIGILATKPGNDCLIWSLDKDLMQIPGRHLVDEAVVLVTQEDGDALFYRQTLTGDSVDNYPGCPGIGPVKADKLLGGGGGWKAIVTAYEKAGLTEEDALVQARLARILQHSDWDTEQGEPILWTPTATA